MITKVLYRRLYNLGNYENEAFEVEVTVDGAEPEAAEAAWQVAFESVELARMQATAEREQRDEAMRSQYAAQQARRRNSDVPF